MAENKSTILFAASREAQQKFDYFVAAVTGAIFTYVAQTYKPKQLEWSPESLEPVALIFLAFSFFIGLKRIEAVNISMRHNFEVLSASETAGRMTEAISGGMGQGYNPETGELLFGHELPDERDRYRLEAQFASEAFQKVSNAASRYYLIRNYFLYAGFGALFFAKILSPYFDTTKPQTQQTDRKASAPQEVSTKAPAIEPPQKK